MRRILIVANTYYQLIMAIQMRHTIFLHDDVTLLLSDHSRGTMEISRRLKELDIFSMVKYVETKEKINRETKLSRLREFRRLLVNGQSDYFYVLNGLANINFDELIAYNFGPDIYGIFAHLARINPNISLSSYEEGVLSYGWAQKSKMSKKWRVLRHLVGKKDISDIVDKFYCLYPELYVGDLTPAQVPQISRLSECAKVLKEIFSLDERSLTYPEKYIFFTSVYDFEGGKPIGEYEAACRVAELVGKENLLIKVHPRDTRTIYADNGFKIDKNSSIPWEAMQLSGDFTDKVFLTATSGSVLAGSFLSDTPVRTYFLYKLCDFNGNAMAVETRENIERLLANESMNDVLKFVTVPEDVKCILDE